MSKDMKISSENVKISDRLRGVTAYNFRKVLELREMDIIVAGAANVMNQSKKPGRN